MAGLNAAEVLAKSIGDVYRAAHGEAAPSDTDIETEAALEALGWEHMGWVAEEGPELVGFEGETTSLFGWNRPTAIITNTQAPERQVTVPLLQFNVETLQLYFPGSTYSALTRTLTIPESGTSTPYAFLMVISDGTKYHGLYIPKVTGRPGGPLTFPDGQEELSQLPITFDVLADAADIAFIGVDPAEEGS